MNPLSCSFPFQLVQLREHLVYCVTALEIQHLEVKFKRFTTTYNHFSPTSTELLFQIIIQM